MTATATFRFETRQIANGVIVSNVDPQSRYAWMKREKTGEQEEIT